MPTEQDRRTTTHSTGLYVLASVTAALLAWVWWPPLGLASHAILGGSWSYVAPEQIARITTGPLMLWTFCLTAVGCSIVLVLLRPRGVPLLLVAAGVAAVVGCGVAGGLLQASGVSGAMFGAIVVVSTGFPLVAAGAMAVVTRWALLRRLLQRNDSAGVWVHVSPARRRAGSLGALLVGVTAVAEGMLILVASDAIFIGGSFVALGIACWLYAAWAAHDTGARQ